VNPGKILVIDDEPVICQGCRLALTEKGYRVDFQLRGGSGLEGISEGHYDLILLDLKLPDMDGMDILKSIRQNHPLLQVVVMTAYSTVQNAVEAMKSGAFDYLIKPFTDGELSLVVERAVEKKRLMEENLSLRKELFHRFSFENIIGQSPVMVEIFEQIERVAPTDSTVMLYGESGTGKELFAGAIHTHSPKASRQFIQVDCNTLSPGLLESELFGHVKGAFTGAVREKEGIFDLAHGGTLFLDEISNLNLEIQGKLLRVIETGEFKPVGATQFHRTDIRVITATNRDLKNMVEEGGFREDLFYRLNVVPIFIPALRERKEDIPILAYHFLRFFSRKMGKRIEGFSDEALETLIHFDWPGNVRQLKNVIERLVIMADNATLDLFYLLDQLQTTKSWKGDRVPGSLEELKAGKKHLLEEVFGHIEKAFVLKALKACQGNITLAAKRVGMQRPNFCSLMKKRHITADREKYKPR
jgi:two-component system NtrC family response regulator